MLHAAEPGVAFRRPNVEVLMRIWNANRTVFFAVSIGAVQPTAEKTREFVARRCQVGWVHAEKFFGRWRYLHFVVKCVDQSADPTFSTGRMIRRVAEAKPRYDLDFPVASHTRVVIIFESPAHQTCECHSTLPTVVVRLHVAFSTLGNLVLRLRTTS